MKKLLAMLALVGFTSAFAQSSLQLFGNIDQTVYRGTYGGNSLTTSSSSAGSTSYWGIRGSENLGGGTTAGFELRSEVSLNQGAAGSATTGISGTDSRSSTIFNRAAYVQLANSNLGTLQVGRQPSAWFEMTTGYNNTGITSYGWAAANAVVSGSTSQHLLYNGTDLSAAGKALSYMGASSGNPGYTGTAEAFIGGVSYTTPKIGGFTGKIQTGTYDTSYTTSKSANSHTGASLDYTAGNLRLGYGLDVKNDSNGDIAYVQRAIGATLDVPGGYKLTAARNYTSFGGLAKAQGGHDMTVTALGVGKTVGKWEYNAGYTTLNDDVDSANKFRLIGATARYNFSKQTSWYVGIGQGKNQGSSRLGPVYASSAGVIPAAGDVGQTVNSMLTGVRYQF